jgi:6-phosphogluconolactonase
MANEQITMVNTFENISTLEDNLAAEITTKLAEEIAKNGAATLLISGGSTPIGLYKKMSTFTIDWSKVTIGLVDERFVENTSDFSNEKLAKNNLMIHHAAVAKFFPMVVNVNDVEDNTARVNEQYSIFKNPTVVVLGMGGDGHTASLFPSDVKSEENVASNTFSYNVIQTFAPAEPKIRITCSKQLLLSGKHIYLMITGKEKLSILETAAEKQLPISYFTDKTIVYFT